MQELRGIPPRRKATILKQHQTELVHAVQEYGGDTRARLAIAHNLGISYETLCRYVGEGDNPVADYELSDTGALAKSVLLAWLNYTVELEAKVKELQAKLEEMRQEESQQEMRLRAGLIRLAGEVSNVK